MADFITLTLVFLFFVISLAIGYFASKKEDAEGYLIANRKLGLFQSVMTLSGSFIGAMTLLVYTAFVFTYGISALWIFVGFIIGFIIHVTGKSHGIHINLIHGSVGRLIGFFTSLNSPDTVSFCL